MEDDDEFGDLYTDVLHPFQTTSFAPTQPPVQLTPNPPSRPIDINDRITSDDEEILYGSKSSTSFKSDQRNQNLTFNLNNSNKTAPKIENFSDQGARVFEKNLTFEDEVDKGGNSQIKDEDMDENFGIEDAGDAGDDDGEEFMIPGLSASGARVLEPGGDDWEDSDSEDDLQIVLNDDTTGVGMMGMDGGLNEEGDEDGDDLVIVTGDVDPNQYNHQPMEEVKDWGDDGGQAVEGGGELLGGDGGAAGVQKMGFGGHGYHTFHSQFKYVRPGAAPIPGGAPAAVGGAPGQVRPPGGLLPFAGRGRGEWRPAGINKNVPPNMQKSFHSGYGMQGWGNNGAGRGLDFTLPSHKTIFEVDIDGFEEKPWRLQGIDMSDFFNFGMNEESWKEYCKQLDQHRLEATMQSKIRVYESGRTEQNYDPDLPPELAAAAGHDIPYANRNIGKIDMQIDLTNGFERARMELPTGKPIQVETGSGERLPSIDTRQPRIRDSDAIIEIVLQRSPSPEPESVQGDDVEDVSLKENKKEGFEVEDNDGSEGDQFDKPQAYNNGKKREVEDHLDSRHRAFDRPVKRTASNRSPRLTDNQNEESIESVDRKQSPSSSPLTLGSAENLSFDQNTNGNNILKDEESKHKMKKQKLIPREHSSVERSEDREDSIHNVHIWKPMYETRHQWESNQGYHRSNSHHKYENYDRKRLKESEMVWHENMMKRSRKARENERSEKNEYRSRKPLENGGWKGDHDREMNPILKRDDGLKTQTHHHTVVDGMQSKQEEPLHSHKESSSRRKREREDNLQREKVERQREREKDKSWVGHTRSKEDSRSSNKDYPGREVASRREKIENETVSRHRGREDAYIHGNSKINNEERIPSRYEKGYSGTSKDMKHKETLKKGKETEGAIHNSLSTSRRNREDNSSQKSERASSRGNIERASDQNPVARKSSKKHKEKETASSDDDEHQEFKKGRSKLERWTSHKDKDSGLDVKETEHIKPQENVENLKPLVEEKNEDAKPPEDKHLDTVEKLKKRSERFKLPMPSEKEALAVKKIETEPLVTPQPETRPESEVKPERPARKRRWTSG